MVLREQSLTLAEGEPERFVAAGADRPVDQATDDIIEAVVAAMHRHGVRLAHGEVHQDVLLGSKAFMETAVHRNAAGPGAEVHS